jgi:hypothetical protein
MKSLHVPKLFRGVGVLKWEDIPPLAVVCGANGAGKSHLLHLIAIAHDAAPMPPDALLEDPQVVASPRPKLVGYAPPNWIPDVEPTGPELFDAISAAHDLIEGVSPPLPPVSDDAIAARLSSSLPLHGRDSLSSAQLIRRMAAVGALRFGIALEDRAARLGTYGAVTYEPMKPLQALADLFYAYALAPPNERPSVAPWDTANDLLRKLAVRFTVVPPAGYRFKYSLQCRLPRGNRIHPSSLSSGEQTALLLVAVVVCTALLSPFAADAPATPDLLLLDEPDAHLHTSLIKQLLTQLQVLGDNGTQIIMTTHRSETIMLAPAGSLFVLRQVGPVAFSIARPASPSALVAALAADLVTVLPGVRIVLVEDEADRRFHQGTYDRAVKLGLLPANPRLAFMPVVAKKGGGGKAAVRKRVEELAAEGLLSIHRGLIDRDGEDDDLPPGVLRHDRYAIENFFADPIALYCAMVNASELDDHVGWSKAVGLRRGDLAELRRADAAQLQRVADHVIAAFTSSPGLPDLDRTALTLHGDAGAVVVSYPRWVFETSKADLRTAIGKLHPKAGPGVLNAEHLTGGPELSGLVPADLIATYHRLITERL